MKAYSNDLREKVLKALQSGQAAKEVAPRFDVGIIKEIVASAGIKLEYLPPYSPDLNPVEAMWSKVKKQSSKDTENKN